MSGSSSCTGIGTSGPSGRPTGSMGNCWAASPGTCSAAGRTRRSASTTPTSGPGTPFPPRGRGALRAWLARITRNLSLDRWKTRQAEKRGGGAETLLGELEDCLPAPGGPERALEDRELAEALEGFLRGLSREGRAMFLRRYWYGQGVAEIAGDLGCGEGKVKSSLFRSRKALREFLEKEGIAV